MVTDARMWRHFLQDGAPGENGAADGVHETVAHVVRRAVRSRVTWREAARRAYNRQNETYVKFAHGWQRQVFSKNGPYFDAQQLGVRSNLCQNSTVIGDRVSFFCCLRQFFWQHKKWKNFWRPPIDDVKEWSRPYFDAHQLGVMFNFDADVKIMQSWTSTAQCKNSLTVRETQTMRRCGRLFDGLHKKERSYAHVKWILNSKSPNCDQFCFHGQGLCFCTTRYHKCTCTNFPEVVHETPWIVSDVFNVFEVFQYHISACQGLMSSSATFGNKQVSLHMWCLCQLILVQSHLGCTRRSCTPCSTTASGHVRQRNGTPCRPLAWPACDSLAFAPGVVPSRCVPPWRRLTPWSRDPRNAGSQRRPWPVDDAASSSRAHAQWRRSARRECSCAVSGSHVPRWRRKTGGVWSRAASLLCRCWGRSDHPCRGSALRPGCCTMSCTCAKINKQDTVTGCMFSLSFVHARSLPECFSASASPSRTLVQAGNTLPATQQPASCCPVVLGRRPIGFVQRLLLLCPNCSRSGWGVTNAAQYKPNRAMPQHNGTARRFSACPMLNFDAGVKRTSTRHQSENHATLKETHLMYPPVELGA